jgi:hypothetical protein
MWKERRQGILVSVSLRRFRERNSFRTIQGYLQVQRDPPGY